MSPYYPVEDLFPPDLIVIPCGAGKDRDRRDLPAYRRYTSTHFRLAHAAAHTLADSFGHIEVAHSVAILSARYGLIREARPIPHYDLRMTQLAAADLDKMVGHVTRALDHRGPARVHLLTPKAYTDVMRRAVERMRQPAEVVTYFDGARGIGDQRAVLSRLVREALTPVP